MARTKLTKAETAAIEGALTHYKEHKFLFEGFATSIVDALTADTELRQYIHFIKYRLKSEDRLRSKMTKKMLESRRGTVPTIGAENLFEEVNDLAGVRVLHLHTSQLDNINSAVHRVTAEKRIAIREGPTAYCWDVEYERLFADFGIATSSRESMYTSVHYVLQMNERTKITAELQVRTLMEEVWGEVSHRLSYGQDQHDELIVNQIKVLARLTSGSTRLVDTIFQAVAQA